MFYKLFEHNFAYHSKIDVPDTRWLPPTVHRVLSDLYLVFPDFGGEATSINKKPNEREITKCGFNFLADAEAVFAKIKIQIKRM